MTLFPHRGDIYLVNLDPTIDSEINKTRPALIISNDINNQAAETVTVIPITSSTERIYPFEAYIPSQESGLHKDSKAKCNQIRTIDKRRLARAIGKLSSAMLEEVEKAMLIHLGV
jgi:mRNA interferase MazF